MGDRAVVQGTYADFKIVRTRSVIQMVIEVPVEHWKPLVDAFGMPQPGEEIPVAVARLDTVAARAGQTGKEVYQKKTQGEQAVVRAALHCRDKEFQRWVEDAYGVEGDEEENAANFIRTTCGIESRSALATNSDALDKFLNMEAKFMQMTGRAAEER